MAMIAGDENGNSGDHLGTSRQARSYQLIMADSAFREANPANKAIFAASKDSGGSIGSSI